jgi:hypothetical protein
VRQISLDCGVREMFWRFAGGGGGWEEDNGRFSCMTVTYDFKANC